MSEFLWAENVIIIWRKYSTYNSIWENKLQQILLTFEKDFFAEDESWWRREIVFLFLKIPSS